MFNKNVEKRITRDCLHTRPGRPDASWCFLRCHPSPTRTARRTPTIPIVLPATFSRVEVKGSKGSWEVDVWNSPPTETPPPRCPTISAVTVIFTRCCPGRGFDQEMGHSHYFGNFTGHPAATPVATLHRFGATEALRRKWIKRHDHKSTPLLPPVGVLGITNLITLGHIKAEIEPNTARSTLKHCCTWPMHVNDKQVVLTAQLFLCLFLVLHNSAEDFNVTL